MPTTALVGYRFAAPANRHGYASGWTGGAAEAARKVITLLVFGAFTCFVGAAAFMFAGRG